MNAASPYPFRRGALIAGKYRLERVLGEGGAGLVVAAKHVELDQLVAIKLLSQDLGRDAILRCRREARAAARIQSEHVVKVHDVGALDDGTPYIVMEFLEGIDLARRIDDVIALPAAEAVEYALQTCSALAAVHAAGIVHRDLKPANIFITRRDDGTALVKLLDFGLSKLLVGSGLAREWPSITSPSEVAGSPAYMPPEQVRGDVDLDERADIWAIGAILYEALSGRVPFGGRSVPELLARVLQANPTPLGELCPDIPPELEAIVMRCLRKDREGRFADIRDLARALDLATPIRAASAPRRGQTLRTPSVLITRKQWEARVADPEKEVPRTVSAVETRVRFRGKLAVGLVLLGVVLLGTLLYARPQQRPSPTPEASVEARHNIATFPVATEVPEAPAPSVGMPMSAQSNRVEARDAPPPPATKTLPPVSRPHVTRSLDDLPDYGDRR